jgi:transcriptional regulator with XRE-family HTH domain
MTGMNALGSYLKDRRARLDPAALGYPLSRRRTPGLRREEVALRANVSSTWYTWLEQGRGGAPSADVLDRIARAMLLTEAEREHLFLLALGHLPEARYRTPTGIAPHLQRVLDAMIACPAMVHSSTWDVLAWNHAATLVLTDYGTLAPKDRNLLRLVFTQPRIRAVQADWMKTARFVVAAFRADVTRAGALQDVAELLAELHRISPEFAAIWAENEVQSTFGEAAKTLRHPLAGPITLDHSSFAVGGRPDLHLVVYTPATPEDQRRVQRLIDSK